MKLYTKLQQLIGTRATKRGICDSILAITGRTTKLSPFEENLPENDLGFQFNLGMDGDTYLDFDIYLIKTRAKSDTSKPIWYVTEINRSY